MFRLESISVSSVCVCSVQLIGTRRDLSKAWARQLSREKQVCSSMRVSIEKIPPLPPNKMSSYRVSQVSERWGRASMPSVNANLAKKPSSVCPVPSLCPVYDLRSHYSSDITPPISSIGSVRWEGHRGHTALLFIELVRERDPSVLISDLFVYWLLTFLGLRFIQKGIMVFCLTPDHSILLSSGINIP